MGNFVNNGGQQVCFKMIGDTNYVIFLWNLIFQSQRFLKSFTKSWDIEIFNFLHFFVLFFFISFFYFVYIYLPMYLSHFLFFLFPLFHFFSLLTRLRTNGLSFFPFNFVFSSLFVQHMQSCWQNKTGQILWYGCRTLLSEIGDP